MDSTTDRLSFSISIPARTGEWLSQFAQDMGTTRNSAINFILILGIRAFEDSTKRTITTDPEEVTT